MAPAISLRNEPIKALMTLRRFGDRSTLIRKTSQTGTPICLYPPRQGKVGNEMIKALTLTAKAVFWMFVGPYRILLRAGDSASESGWLVSRSLAGIYLIVLVVMFGSCGILARASDPAVSYLGFAVMFGVCVCIAFHVNQMVARIQSNRRAAMFHGTARWASEKEIAELSIAANTLIPAGGFYVGHYKSKRNKTEVKVCLPRSEAVLHGIVFAPPARGKSRGYSIPNCAWARETSIVTTDPKSEFFY